MSSDGPVRCTSCEYEVVLLGLMVVAFSHRVYVGVVQLLRRAGQFLSRGCWPSRVGHHVHLDFSSVNTTRYFNTF